MSANRKVKDIEEHAAAQAKLDTAVKRSGLGVKRHKATVEPFDTSSIPPGTFEAATPRPPKLPDVTIPVLVDTILGVDALLRNAIFQMGLGDTEGVRRNVQSAIAKLYPAFEECGKALARPNPKPVYLITPADLRGTISPRVRKAVMDGSAMWMPGFDSEGDMKALLAERDRAAGFRWPESWGTDLGA